MPSVTSEIIERLQRRSGNNRLSPPDEEVARNVSEIAYEGQSHLSPPVNFIYLLLLAKSRCGYREYSNHLRFDVNVDILLF